MTEDDKYKLKTVLFHHWGELARHESGQDVRIGCVRNNYIDLFEKLNPVYFSELKPYLSKMEGQVPYTQKLPVYRDLEMLSSPEKLVIITLDINLSYDQNQTLWLLQHHFDLYGLIEKGLAIEKGATND